MADVAPWALHFGTHERRVIVAGHSHVLSVMQALGAAWRDAVSVAYTTDIRDGPPFDDDYWRWLRDVTTDQCIAIMWNGNQHHASFLIEPDPPLAVWPAAAGSGAAMMVPRSMLAAYWAPSFEQLHVALDLLVPARRVVLLATPPPKRQVDLVRNLAVEVWFEEAARELGVGVGELPVTDEAVRLAMWGILQDELRRVADQRGIAYLPVPEEVVDADGFLRLDCSDADATHANARYGDAVCDQLEELIAR